MRARGVLCLALVGFLNTRCGDDVATLNIPSVGTEYVLIGSAAAGKPLSPGDVRIVLATSLDTLEVPGNGNVEVDMLFAGIKAEDLPIGMSPEQIEFVSDVSPVTKRALPPLTEPHILNNPVLGGTEGVLVPVFDENASETIKEERTLRLEGLTERIAIKDPCSELTWDTLFELQRIPAEIIQRGHVTSAQDAYFGLSTTSTAILGRLQPGRSTLELIGVDTGEFPIEGTERADILDVGLEEITGRDGRPAPRTFTMIRGGVLGHVGLWSEPDNKYIDVTPRDLTVGLGDIVGTSFVQLDGEEAICTHGEVLRSCIFPLSGECRGGIWCKKESSASWEVVADIKGAGRFTRLIERDGLPLIATALSGAVYSYKSDGTGWREVLVPAVNQQCNPFCVGFPHVALAGPEHGSLIAVMGGNKGETLAITGTSLATIEAKPIQAVSDALFGDERGGDMPMDFQAVGISPDGAVWFGSDRKFLVRVSSDFESAERLCLPVEADGVVTAFAGRDNGELVIGVSPPRIGITHWNEL